MTKGLKADLSLLLVTVVWGASFPIMSVVLKYIPPYSLVALRYFLSGIILAIIFHKKFKNINGQTIKAGIIIGISLFIGCALQFVGLLYTTPSKSGFITGLNVAVVPIVLAIMYKKLPELKTVVGVILSIIGLGIMSINGKMGINFGDILTLISAIAFGGQIILVDIYVKNVDVMILTCIELLTVGILGFIPAIGVEKLNVILNPVSIGALIFMILFCTIIAFTVQNKMQPYTDPTHAAIIFLAEPVFSAIFSMLIGDKLTGRTLLGCAFIFVGMIAINVNNNSVGSTLEKPK